MAVLSLTISIFVALLLTATNAIADTYHANSYSQTSHLHSSVFLYQGIEGEFGKASRTSIDKSKSENRYSGFGITNGLGIEMMKFSQLSISHTHLDYRNKEVKFESLVGSRLNASLKFVFVSPIGNLESGGGVSASSFRFQNSENITEHLGNGSHWSVGLNRFTSSNFSYYINFKKITENLKGHDKTTIKNSSTSIGLGLKLWH